MKHLLAFLIILISFPMLSSLTLVGQSDVTQSAKGEGENRYQAKTYFARKEIAIQAAKDLKEGTLIVRLISFNEKIEHLKKRGQTEKAQKEQLKIDTINKSFVKEFLEVYNFSEVVFCFGTELNNYLKDEKSDVFLNKELMIDPTIKIKDGPIFILASQASDGYYLYDVNFNRIPEPAPHAIFQKEVNPRKISFDRFFENIFARESFYDSVLYFNDKLNNLAKLNKKNKSN